MQPQKTLVIAMGPTLKYHKTLCDELAKILGSVSSTDIVKKGKLPIEAALKEKGADRSALLRKIVSPHLNPANFQWERRSLEALVVRYSATFSKSQLNPAETAVAICSRAHEHFGEKLLEQEFVAVSEYFCQLSTSSNTQSLQNVL